MWNYRVGTKIHIDGEIGLINQTFVREFFIFTCYYDKEGKPNGYPQMIEDGKIPNVLCYWENKADLEATHNLIKLAFEKPIIDLDNFPNIFTEDTND